MKILFYSDSPALLTGMGRVIRDLAIKFYNNGDEVVCAGWHHNRTSKLDLPYPVYHIDKNYESIHQLRVIIEKFRPDYVFCLGDLFNFFNLNRMKYDISTKNIPQAKYIAYLNVDSEGFSTIAGDVLNCFDKIIATSNFGKKSLLQVPSIHKKDDISVVYHGVDPEIFKFLDKRKDENTFNILINSRNTNRKNIPVSLEAFSIFSNKHPYEIVLNLLTRVNDKEGYDLSYFLTEYNISENTNIHAGSDSLIGITDTEINQIYNSSHVLLSSSMGEGFGLPILEGMSTGCVPIATSYSSLVELVKGRGSLIPTVGWIYHSHCQKLAVVNSENIVSILEKHYEDWKYFKSEKLNKLQKLCIEYASLYTLDKVYTDIRKIITSTLPDFKYPLPLDNTLHPTMLDLRSSLFKDKKNIKKKKFIGVIKMGGFGDTVQLIPVLKAIRKKYPNDYITVIIENGVDLISCYVDKVIRIMNSHYSSILKSVVDVFDITYDMRYISRIYGEQNTDFSDRYISFYNGWAMSNNRIRIFKKHVIELMLESTGLDKYANINDMKLITEEINIKKIFNIDNFIIIHNNTGNVGNLKELPKTDCEQIVELVNNLGYTTVQLGLLDEKKINGIKVDLRGKVDNTLIPTLVKEAQYYIGLEGYLYHVAKAVNTKAIVWCTCAPPECFTYEKNLVLYKDNCTPCWWSHSPNGKWWEKCYLSEKRCLNLPNINEILMMIKNRLEIDE